METALRKEQTLESLATTFSEYLQLPHPVHLALGECGVSNAFYDPKEVRVVFCYELLVELASLTAKEPDQEELFGGAFAFILTHEIGHAIIDGLKLPVLGREEDAADELAALAMLDSAEDRQLVSGAVLWLAAHARAERRTKLTTLADEHALSEQRLYNMLCWMYGADPFGNVEIVASGALPAARAARCGEEFRQLQSSWYQLLGTHLKKRFAD